MEVLGVVAAVPELIKIVRKTGKLIRDCASKARFSKATKGLDSQLKLLQDILNNINTRWMGSSLPSAELRQLGPVLKELREELESLNRLLANAISPSFFTRMKMSLFGFEKQLKEHVSQIESIKSLLTLKMAEEIYATVTGKAKFSILARSLVGLVNNPDRNRHLGISRFSPVADQRGVATIHR